MAKLQFIRRRISFLFFCLVVIGVLFSFTPNQTVFAHDYVAPPSLKCPKASWNFGERNFLEPVLGPHADLSSSSTTTAIATDWYARDLNKPGIPRMNADGTFMAGDAFVFGESFTSKNCLGGVRIYDIRTDAAVSFTSMDAAGGAESYERWYWKPIKDTRYTLVDKNGSSKVVSMINGAYANWDDSSAPDALYSGSSLWKSDLDKVLAGSNPCTSPFIHSIRDTLYSFGKFCPTKGEQRDIEKGRPIKLKSDLLLPIIAETEWRFVWSKLDSQTASSEINSMEGHGGYYNGKRVDGDKDIIWSMPPRIIPAIHDTDTDLRDINNNTITKESVTHKEPLFMTEYGLEQFNDDYNKLTWHHNRHLHTGPGFVAHVEIGTDLPIQSLREYVNEQKCIKGNDGCKSADIPGVFILNFNETHKVWDYDDNNNGKTDVDEKYTEPAKLCFPKIDVKTSSNSKGFRIAVPILDGYSCDGPTFDAFESSNDPLLPKGKFKCEVSIKSSDEGKKFKVEENASCKISTLTQNYKPHPDYPGHGTFLLKAEHAHKFPLYTKLTDTSHGHDYIPPDDTRSIYFKHGYKPGQTGQITIEAQSKCGSKIKNGESCDNKTLYETINLKRVSSGAPIIQPQYDLRLIYPYMPDLGGLPAKNLDGTYYVGDPVGVKYTPDFQGTTLDGKDRWQHMRFTNVVGIEDNPFTIGKAVRTFSLHHDGQPDMTFMIPSFNGTYPLTEANSRNMTFSNGQGIGIYNFTHNPLDGKRTSAGLLHSWEYIQNAFNLNRKIEHTTVGEFNRFIAPYAPAFGKSLGYTYWPDGGERELDNRLSMLIDYRGGVHTDKHKHTTFTGDGGGINSTASTLLITTKNPLEEEAFASYIEGIKLGLTVPSWDVSTKPDGRGGLLYEWDENKYPRAIFTARDYGIIVNETSWRDTLYKTVLDKSILEEGRFSGAIGTGMQIALDEEIFAPRLLESTDDVWGGWLTKTPPNLSDEIPDYDRHRRAVANAWANNITAYDLLGRESLKGTYYFEQGRNYTYDTVSLPLGDYYNQKDWGDPHNWIYRLDVSAVENVTGAVIAHVPSLEHHTSIPLTGLDGEILPKPQEPILRDDQIFRLDQTNMTGLRIWGPFDYFDFDPKLNQEREDRLKYLVNNKSHSGISWYTDGTSKIVWEHGPYKSYKYDVYNTIQLYTVNMAGIGNNYTTWLASQIQPDFQDAGEEAERKDERRAGPVERKAGRYNPPTDEPPLLTPKEKFDTLDKSQQEQINFILSNLQPAKLLHTTSDGDMNIRGHADWYSTYVASSVDSSKNSVKAGLSFNITIIPQSGYNMSTYIYDRTLADLLWKQGQHIDADGNGHPDNIFTDWFDFDLDNANRINSTAHLFASSIRHDYERALYANDGAGGSNIIKAKDAGIENFDEFGITPNTLVWHASSTQFENSTNPPLRMLFNSPSENAGIMNTHVYTTPYTTETSFNGTLWWEDSRDRAEYAPTQPQPSILEPSIMNVSDQLKTNYGNIDTLEGAWRAQIEDLTGISGLNPYGNLSAIDSWGRTDTSRGSGWGVQSLFNETNNRLRTMAIHNAFEAPPREFLSTSLANVTVIIDTADRQAIIYEDMETAFYSADYVFDFNVYQNNSMVPHITYNPHTELYEIRLTDFESASSGDDIEYIKIKVNDTFTTVIENIRCPPLANECFITTDLGGAGIVQVPDPDNPGEFLNQTLSKVPFIEAGGSMGGVYKASEVPVAYAPTGQSSIGNSEMNALLLIFIFIVMFIIIWKILLRLGKHGLINQAR